MPGKGLEPLRAKCTLEPESSLSTKFQHPGLINTIVYTDIWKMSNFKIRKQNHSIVRFFSIFYARSRPVNQRQGRVRYLSGRSDRKRPLKDIRNYWKIERLCPHYICC